VEEMVGSASLVVVIGTTTTTTMTTTTTTILVVMEVAVELDGSRVDLVFGSVDCPLVFCSSTVLPTCH
jgi:hypothetical protein